MPLLYLYGCSFNPQQWDIEERNKISIIGKLDYINIGGSTQERKQSTGANTMGKYYITIFQTVVIA